MTKIKNMHEMFITAGMGDCRNRELFTEEEVEARVDIQRKLRVKQRKQIDRMKKKAIKDEQDLFKANDTIKSLRERVDNLNKSCSDYYMENQTQRNELERVIKELFRANVRIDTLLGIVEKIVGLEK